MTQQPPNVLIDQIRKNLRSSSEVAVFRERSGSVKKFIDEHRYSEFTKDLNESRRGFGSGQLFTKEDFQGALVYPDSRFIRNYTVKHTLAPLSFGILVDPNRWNDVARKLNLDPKHNGQSLESKLFRNSIFGLDEIGVTFHVNRGLQTDVEFEVLYADIGLYSETQSYGRRITPEKLMNPPLAILTMEYLVLSDLCAWRADPESTPESVTNYLQNRVNYYITLIPQILGLPETHIKEAEVAYRTILEGVVQNIPPAVYSTFELDKKIKPKFVTPILFSLGSTQEELKRNHLLSPLIGLKNYSTYFRTGDIEPVQVRNILVEKGYVENSEETNFK